MKNLHGHVAPLVVYLLAQEFKLLPRIKNFTCLGVVGCHVEIVVLFLMSAARGAIPAITT